MVGNTTELDLLKARNEHITLAIKKLDTDLNMNQIAIRNQQGDLEEYNEKKQIEARNELVNEQKIILEAIVNEKNRLNNEYKNLKEYEILGKRANAVNDKIKNYISDTRNTILQDYSTNRRQIQINQYNYSQRKNTIYILKLLFITILISIGIACIHKYTELLSLDTTRSIIYGIFLIFLVVFILNWYKNNKRSNIYWNNIDFDSPTTDNVKCGKDNLGNYSGCVGDELYNIKITENSSPKEIRNNIKKMKELQQNGFKSIKDMNKNIKLAYEIEKKAYENRIEKDREKYEKLKEKHVNIQKRMNELRILEEKNSDPEISQEKCVNVYD